MSRRAQRRGGPRTPLYLLAAGGLLLLVAIVWGAVASRTPAPPAEPAAIRDPDDIPRVGLAEAREAFDSGRAIFLDVRLADDFEASHTPGALSIPLNEIERRLGDLNPDDWIITYCT